MKTSSLCKTIAYHKGVLIDPSGKAEKLSLERFADRLVTKKSPRPQKVFLAHEELWKLARAVLCHKDLNPDRPYLKVFYIEDEFINFRYGNYRVCSLRALDITYQPKTAKDLWERVSLLRRRYPTAGSPNAIALEKLKQSVLLNQGLEMYRLRDTNLEKEIRQSCAGGRVECIADNFTYKGRVEMLDVNSCYPYIASTFKHPYAYGCYRRTARGEPPHNEAQFILWRGKSFGGVPLLVQDHPDDYPRATYDHSNIVQEFTTNRVEFEWALRENLIECKEIIHSWCFELEGSTDFAAYFKSLQQDKEDYKMLDLEQELLETKLRANMVIGKFAADTIGHKECAISLEKDIHEGYDHICKYESEASGEQPTFNLFKKKKIYSDMQRKFVQQNVSTASSIWSHARVHLMTAVLATIKAGFEVFYYDTDCIIATGFPDTIPRHPTKLGCWKTEAVGDLLAIRHRKHYLIAKGNKIQRSANIVEGSKITGGLKQRLERSPVYLLDYANEVWDIDPRKNAPKVHGKTLLQTLQPKAFARLTAKSAYNRVEAMKTCPVWFEDNK